mmetsp:Transcript_24833/g.74719  ORF Transcript_24833/g.74719 Transcript_24833/m.74719 type:complete len:163 (-) Transcript_24833:161-649(-)
MPTTSPRGPTKARVAVASSTRQRGSFRVSSVSTRTVIGCQLTLTQHSATAWTSPTPTVTWRAPRWPTTGAVTPELPHAAPPTALTTSCLTTRAAAGTGAPNSSGGGAAWVCPSAPGRDTKHTVSANPDDLAASKPGFCEPATRAGDAEAASLWENGGCGHSV